MCWKMLYDLEIQSLIITVEHGVLHWASEYREKWCRVPNFFHLYFFTLQTWTLVLTVEMELYTILVKTNIFGFATNPTVKIDMLIWKNVNLLHKKMPTMWTLEFECFNWKTVY